MRTRKDFHRNILRRIISRWRLAVCLLLGFCQIYLCSCASLEAIPDIFTATNWALGRLSLSTRGIDAQDLKDLDEGNLLAVKNRYESFSSDVLTFDQQRLLCDLYTKYYEIDQALNCLECLEKNAPKSDISAIAGKRALIYLQSGDYEKAIRYSRGLSSHGGRYVYALVAVQMGRKKEALEIASDFERYAIPKIAFFAANIFIALGEYSRAIDIAFDPSIRLAMDYGLKPFKDIFGKKIQPAVFRADIFDEFNFGIFDFFSYSPRSNIYVEFIVAKALLETGHIEEAKERFDIIINYDRISPFRDIYWMSLFEQGRINEMEGNIDTAIDLYCRTIDLIEAIRSTINTDLGRIGFIADKQKVYWNLITLLIRKGRNTLAFEYVERARGRALVDLLSNKTEFSTASGDSPDTPRILEKLIYTQKELRSDSPIEDPNHFNRLRSTVKQTIDALRQYGPWHSNLITGRTLSFDELHNIVQEDEAFIGYYFVRNKGGYVFVLKKHRDPTFKMLRTGNLEEAVMDFRAHLELDLKKYPEKRHSLAYLSKAHDLYKWLIEPVKDELKDVKRITFLPSGILFYLPFGALYTGQNLLFEKYVIKVLVSLTIADLIRSSDEASESTLVLANPLGDLQYAEIEGIRIQETVPNALLLLRSNASDNQFRQLSNHYSYIHIASHAAFDEIQPLESKLCLAKTEQTSGEITVYDLYKNINLNANLVVLSACQTALSRVANGDEILGLTTGVLYAGSSRLIGSLWRIEDEATAFLMEKFYSELRKGYQPADALQKAQLLTRAQERYRHPYFWAAFQLTGR